MTHKWLLQKVIRLDISNCLVVKSSEINEHKLHCNMHLLNLILTNHAKELILKWTTVKNTYHIEKTSALHGESYYMIESYNLYFSFDWRSSNSRRFFAVSCKAVAPVEIRRENEIESRNRWQRIQEGVHQSKFTKCATETPTISITRIA